MITTAELETALEEKGWEPDYREETENGDPLDYPVYEILVGGNRTINIEMHQIDGGGVIALARIWHWDEDGERMEDVWEIEDVSSIESILDEVENYIASV